MLSYWQILVSILPVFGMIAIGIGLRRLKWMTAEADASVLKTVVNCLYPCLIFENVANNPALRDPSNLLLAPLSGFAVMSGCMVASLFVGRALGLTVGRGLRTFAFASGINNYGYFAISLLLAIFGPDALGVLLVHNVGCEASIWTVGILVLAGLSLREGWKKLFNGPIIALVLGLGFNLAGLGARLPGVLTDIIHQCAMCAIPLGLLLIGCTIDEYLERPRSLVDAKITTVSCVLRLGLFPLVYLVLAKYLPCSDEMRQVLIVQGAMPAGMMPIAIARHYGGQPLIAAQVVIGTTALGILTIPLWIKLGIAFVAR
jgi:predicted permease